MFILMVDIVFLGINDIGEAVYEWLNEQEGADVLALLTEKEQLSVIEELEPDLIISSGFRHIVPEDVLSLPSMGAVNMHKSYLPYNRGTNPNVWSIIEDPPAGVSIHYMTPDVDGGPIIDRREVLVYPDDDGRSLYDRLEAEQFEQFTDCWPAIRDDEVETIDQPHKGTYHYYEDFVELWELDLDEEVRVGDLLDRLRALTFPPYDNAYFEVDGEKYHVDIEIRREGERADDEETPDEKNVPVYNEDDYS